MRGSQQGLTLIEVLVALAIFSIVSVAVLAMFPTIFKLNRQTRTDQAVTISAKQFMETMRVRYGTRAGFDAGGTETAPTDCTPVVSDQLSATSAGVTAVVVKRVTLRCTPANQPPQTFVLDLGRPES